MKIDGLNFPLNNQIQIIDELNLKEGQKILGKIVHAANDEVLLDIAGRSLSAKVEENTSLTAGTVRMFQVLNNDQGHVVLKVLHDSNSVSLSAGVKGASSNNTTEGTSPKTNQNAPIDSQTLKAITTSLTQENLPDTMENIAKVYKFIQDFQAKYQQTVSPRVFTFLLAKQMPVTPGTILASWVFQDEGVRNLLWNILCRSLPEKSQLELFSKFVVESKENSGVIQEKLQNILNTKLGDFLEKLIDLDSQSNPTAKNAEKTSKDLVSKFQTLFKEDIIPDKQDLSSLGSKTNLKAQDLESLLSKTDGKENVAKHPPKQLPNSQSAGEVTKPGQELGLQPGKGMKVNQGQEPIIAKGQNLSRETGQAGGVQNRPVSGTPENLDSESQQKVGAILDHNLELNKALASDKSNTMASCVIPFLIRDSGNQLHECMVKWEKEKGSKGGGLAEEFLQLDIPTENLGEIHLAVRINKSGTRINFKVASEEVRRYLLKNTKALKETLPHDSAVIAVCLKNNESSGSNASGVDLWM